MQQQQQQQTPLQHAQQQQMFLQYPQQQQQPFLHQQQQPYPVQLSQSPDMASLPQPEVTQQVTNALHRDLIRENNFQSFNSPSPVLSPDNSVVDLAESPTATDHLPRLGTDSPPGEEAEEIDDLEEDMGQLTLDQQGHERYVGKSSPMFYGRKHYGGMQHAQGPEKAAARRFIDNPDLPSPEAMTHLLNLHFTYVHPFAPVFVWSKFLRRLQERNYTPPFLFLLNSIFALASRYSDDISFRSDPTKPETVGNRFADKAREILDTLYDSPDIHCVGALVLLAFQQMGTGNGYRSWMYIGISIRMAQHLGLNRDSMKLNPRMPAVDREERSRVWWTCFMADRIMSTSFGRPQGIREHDVDATYPEGIDEENIQLEYRLENATSMLTGPSPDSEKNFVYMASLMKILGRVMVSLYSPHSRSLSQSKTSMTNPAPLEELDKELTDWLLTLPPHLQFRSVQQEPGTFVCTLHMTFYVVLILLHRPYSHRSSFYTTNDPSISLSICTSAANNAIEMASNMMKSIDETRGVSRLKCLLHSSVLLFFTAGIVHINNCTSTDPVLAASAKLRTIETLKCLAMVEDVWITGRWCGNNIRQLLEVRHIELPYSSEGFENLPFGSTEGMKKKAGTGSTQTDLSMVGSTPKEQSFAFDVDQIMGYYQGPGAKHTLPQGRNSRHFSPTPYFSPAAGHYQHHSQGGPMKSHPGLTQGHSPLPRRPRQGKNLSPSPSSSASSISVSGPGSTAGYFPSTPDLVATGANFNNNGESSSNSNTQLDPFATPGSATVGTNSAQQSPVETEQPLSNAFQNPFSSSLWGLPTSMDSDDWIRYMQNGGGTGESVLGLGVDGQNSVNSNNNNNNNNNNNSGSSNLSNGNSMSGGNKPEGGASGGAMLGPLSEFHSGLLDQSNIHMTTNNPNISNNNNNTTSSNNRMHPLAQSMTSQELMAGTGQSGIIVGSSGINTSTIPTSSSSSIAIASSSSSSSSSSSIPDTSNSVTTHRPSEYFYLGGNMGMSAQQQQQRPLQQ
ncbi:fungal-specific transcription factor domain-containing protein [Dissophora ornata]|nr:fungal-specific transcription factor domain-containing protein [Dissophora ornata]